MVATVNSTRVLSRMVSISATMSSSDAPCARRAEARRASAPRPMLALRLSNTTTLAATVGAANVADW